MEEARKDTNLLELVAVAELNLGGRVRVDPGLDNLPDG